MVYRDPGDGLASARTGAAPGEGEAAAPRPDEAEAAATSPSRLRLSDLLTKKFDIRSLALTGLFVLAVFYTIYFMRAVLLPLILALLLSYLLRPIVRAFARARISPYLSSAIVLIGLLALAVYSGSFLTAPMASWLEKAPYSLQQLESKLHPLKRPMEKVQQATGEMEKLASSEGLTNKSKPAPVVVNRNPIVSIVFARTTEAVAGGALLLILLYFLLANDGVFLNKLIRLLPTLSDKKRAVSIANEIESQVSRYLLTQTLINTGLGLAIGLTVWGLGLPNPMMWGMVAAVLNFVPYLGALTGIICITLGAILSFDSFSYALIFPAVYLGYSTIEGNLVTPYVMGRSLTLNPVMILFSLIFWGWMWGVPGIILAVPILSAFKIFCAHVEHLAPVAEFLS